MKLISSETLIVKKSKFIGYYYQIDNEDEVKDIINNLKIEHKKYSHIPYAYKIDNIERKYEDKEPNNAAGLPILALINKKNMNHTLVAVVRYFGGIKLGSGGLYIAYMKCANMCLNKKVS